MTIRIEFETSNAAFEGIQQGPEIARILRRLADTLEARGRLHLGYEARLFDANGNRVGEVVLAYRDEDVSGDC